MDVSLSGLSQAAAQALIDASAVPKATPGGIARTLNTAYQPNATYDTQVSYSITIGTVVLSGGTVILEIATNQAFSAGVQTVAQVSSGSILATLGFNLAGIVPAGMWARLRTVNTALTPTFTYIAGQETTA